jgi:hypothetical protein
MSFLDDVTDHKPEPQITIELRGADATLLRELSQRLRLGPLSVVRIALASVETTEATLARR